MESHAEKRPAAADQTVLLDGIRGVIVDVQGTTTPLSFTKEVLVPYTKDNIKTFLEAKFEDADIQKDIEELRKKTADSDDAIPSSDGAKTAIIDAVTKYVLGQLDAETESDGALLEKIWKDAYSTESIQGEVYDDVLPVLRQLVSDGLKIYSYATESVEQQKLLFGYSNQGDMLEIFSSHFDTSVGKKTVKESYEEIARVVELAPSDMLYLTHCPLEAEAASSAGLKTCVVVREGNEALSDAEQQTCNVIYGLDELLDDLGDLVPAKRAHYSYDDYVSTDGATNDSEYTGGGRVTGDEDTGDAPVSSGGDD